MIQPNYQRLALNRFPDGTPKEIWFTEGQDFQTVRAKNTPYDINIYKAIEKAIELGVINVGAQSKGVFDNDQDAIDNGLELGDIYELSETNTLDPNFAGLLKVVKEPTLIIPNILGTETLGQALGTDIPGQVLGIN